ncbi:MAG: hypothetical protein LBI05_00740 [Planctomycetaceae bacterium]|jgi:hypothetical protein|nr:hypothetical protein [Planctomycetaceae bacterium]
MSILDIRTFEVLLGILLTNRTGVVVLKVGTQFAQSHGMYVIVQSGEAVEIVAPPEGFVVKEW